MTAQTMDHTQPSKPSLLRTALRANAIFSDVSGFVCIVGSKWLARITGIPSPLAFVITGVGLIGYAIWLWLNTRDQRDAARIAWTAIIGDAMWVVASVVVLVTGILPLTPAGKWIIGIVADTVGMFAVIQYIGLRRLNT